MGYKEKAKTFVAQVKEGRSELIKSNMQMTAVQANTIPHSDVRSEDGTRKSKSVSKLGADVQRKRAIGRPVVTSKSSNIGPPVPPHTSSLNSAAKAPGDDNVARTQPSITRKPTQTEDSVNGHAEAREKQLPLLNPTIGAGSTLSQEISKTNIIDRELRPQGLETNEQSGPTLGQTFEEQTWKTQEQVRDMKALQDTNYQHVVEIKKLKDELQKESDSHAKTTQAWRKATASLSAHRQETNYKVDDDALRSHFHNIIYDVEGWVSTHCLLKFEHLSESDLRIFGALTPKPSKYYHVKRTRELLLQSLVMHDLAHLVLNRLWWAGKLSDNLCTVQYAMEPDEPHAIPDLLRSGPLRLADVRDYSAWKSKTALLLSEKMNEPALQHNVGTVSADMQTVLEPFLRQTGSHAWTDLEIIIRKTIAFDLELHKSRALFQVHRWSAKNIAEMQFDETRMGTPNGLKAAERGMDVELVLAPMITKTGNADGDAFESLSLISPWIVVCYENRKQVEKM